jgi:hypothetical protein
MTDSPRLCQICRVNPVGPGGLMCPECRDRVAHTAATDPYGWMEGEQ